jgi:hypothetical protein
MESPEKDTQPVPQSAFTRLSLFYGIAIEMGFEDEEPPHIHALYDDKKAKIGLDNRVLDGWLPPIGLEMVQEWISMHQGELQDAWKRCRQGETPSLIHSLYDDDEFVGDGKRLPELVEVEARDGLGIWVRFDDDVSGEVDLSHLAGMGVFKAWDDPGFFQQVFIGEGGEVSWPNEIDIDPYKLYMDVTGKTVEDLFPGWGEGYQADA